MNLSKLALASLLALPLLCYAEQPAVEAFARPSLIGLQLSAKASEQHGRMPPAQARCIQALQPSVFYSVMSAVISDALTPSELEAANEFFASPAGRKFTEQGIAQLLVALDGAAPGSVPVLSDAETREVQTFAASSAGNALIAQNVMQRQAATDAYRVRMQELLQQCRAQ